MDASYFKNTLLQPFKKFWFSNNNQKPNYVTQSVESWEKEYKTGRWDIFQNSQELPRYSIINGYYDFHLQKKGKVLDVGCGDGILQQKFPPDSYKSYLGIDISSEAIRRAAQEAPEHVTFKVADALSFETDELFDCIILNEVLCYFKEPIKLLKKYESYLKANGIIIISQYCDPMINYKQNWQRIDKEFTPADAVKVSHDSGLAWIVKIYK